MKTLRIRRENETQISQNTPAERPFMVHGQPFIECLTASSSSGDHRDHVWQPNFDNMDYVYVEGNQEKF